MARKTGCIWILNGRFHVGKRYILNKNQEIRVFLILTILLKSKQVLYLQHKCQTDARKVFWNVWVINEEYWKNPSFRLLKEICSRSVSLRFWFVPKLFKRLVAETIFLALAWTCKFDLKNFVQFSRVQFSLAIGVLSVDSPNEKI